MGQDRAQPHSLAEITALVQREMAAHTKRGKVADYIPALARVDPNHFGIAIVTCAGEYAEAGDCAEGFSIQSVSKIFALTMALELFGAALWRRVGHEPSGSSFNSIVQLEREHGIPRNPLINAGALVVTDALLQGGPPEALAARLTGFMRTVADDPAIGVDDEVANSEGETGYRNASLANFLRAYGNLHHPVAHVLSAYFHQCALRLNCRQLARAGLYLAHGGTDPLSGLHVTSLRRARRLNALMMTCGHYDASGDVAFRVGLPGKSGVGGGILAIAPGRASIAVWSPGLNEAGTSHIGLMALERLSALTGWSVF
jgi:glutaminase